MNIRLSKEFGVNPTIPICFYCGEEKNEVALLGAAYKENGKQAQAPMSLCIDLVPCDKCKEKFKDMIVLVEKDYPDAQPNGKWAAVKREAFGKIFNIEAPKGGLAYVEPAVIKKLQDMEAKRAASEEV